jgi:hypothetical protein
MDVNLKSLVGFPESHIMDMDVNSPSSKINIMVISIVIIVLIGYYSLLSSLGTGASAASGATSSGAASGLNYIELFLWVIFVFLVLINGMSYIFDMDVVASVKNIFTSKPIIDLSVSDSIKLPEEEVASKKQVFHIPNNKYTYEDAKAICKAYDSRLATYKEIDEAHEKGADWCGFGWSDGQMALYPTQFEKWQNLQKIPGHEHDCGRPGINGGYIANPKIKYGINCYGYKPKINEAEIQDMANKPIYPKTKKEIDFEKKVAKWKEKIPDILISPFNHDNWSVI